MAPREVSDSYTGDLYEEEYTSSIPGIEKGRSPFYKDRELATISEQYWISPLNGGWLLRRRGCPDAMLPVFPALTQAQHAMDWAVQNDGSVRIAIHWLNKQSFDPYFKLLDKLMEVAYGAA